MVGANEPFDKWGSVIESEIESDGDGFHDIAIGTPNESIGINFESGSVTLVYGSSKGLRGKGSKLFHQNSKGIPGASEIADHWGDSLMSADVNGDGKSDLLVSSTAETIITAFDTRFYGAS